MVQPKSKWISVITKPANIRNRVFCFPYAGGSAQSYKEWGTHFPESTQVIGIQLPGRASRFTEPLLNSIDAVIAPLRTEIKPFLDKPFAFFGHSMGAALAFELARILEQEGFKPSHLFVSGRNAPHLPNEREIVHQLSEPEFRRKMRELNGTPPEILEHEELMDLMVPIVRADFTISETYDHQPGYTLTCPMTALGGHGDEDVPENGIAEWRQYTSGPATYHMYEGDHFFINGDSRNAVLRQINQYLANAGF